MSIGMMQDLIDKIRKQYPKLTNKKGDLEHYVYIVKSQEILIDVGRSTGHGDTALTGQITDMRHEKSGIAMMASAYNHRMVNHIFYIPTSKSKSAEIAKELKQIEKNVKSIVLSNYEITDKNAGDTYCSGSIYTKEVSNLLKGFLYGNLAPQTVKEFNEPKFSFSELLDMVTEDGDAWHSIIKNQKTAQFACKLLGVKSIS